MKLREHFHPVHHVPGSCSVVYFAAGIPSQEDLPALEPARLTLDDVHQAWEHSLGCVGPEMRGSVLLCRILFLAEQGWEEAAREETLRLARNRHPCDRAALADARFLLAHNQARLPSGSGRYQTLSEAMELLDPAQRV